MSTPPQQSLQSVPAHASTATGLVPRSAGSAAESTQPQHPDSQKIEAAQLIQRNYRGYRERRQLAGMGLDANTRWTEALKQARWQHATRPIPRSERSGPMSPLDTPEQRARANSASARQNWKRIGEIARRAGGDDPDDADEDEDKLSPGEKLELQQKRSLQKAEREKTAKIMDLQYFLEMVDQKHRYGSNLRVYHEHWMKSDTKENFFYWLDHGEGRNVEMPTVTRERLEKEQVRYLSREERMKYLVKIDEEGRLCWAKNGERISTSKDFKDSVEGVVPKDDPTPAYNNRDLRSTKSSDSSSDSSSSEHSSVEGDHYVNHDLDRAKGMSKIKHVSAATILNHLLRRSVKPNSWLFVADTSFRLYVGIKQSGAFQHSSFLHGARISAAGLIKIKDGQLRKLSPLSGHYRPPTKNFRAFVHSLRENNVDMSRVSISRSYAVLVGLEAYVRTRRKFKHAAEHSSNAKTKVLHPEEAKKKEEAEVDNSQSAERERQTMEEQTEKEEQQKKRESFGQKLWRKMNRSSISSKEEMAHAKTRAILSKSGEDVESAIPPQGTR